MELGFQNKCGDHSGVPDQGHPGDRDNRAKAIAKAPTATQFI